MLCRKLASARNRITSMGSASLPAVHGRASPSNEAAPCGSAGKSLQQGQIAELKSEHRVCGPGKRRSRHRPEQGSTSETRSVSTLETYLHRIAERLGLEAHGCC